MTYTWHEPSSPSQRKYGRTAYVCKIAIRRSRKNHALYSVVDTEGTVTHNIPMHKIEDCIRQNQSRKTTKAHRLPRRQVWEVTQYHCDGQIDNARTALKDYGASSSSGVAGQSPQTGLVAPPQYRARTPGEGCGDRPRPPSEVRRFVPFLRRFVP